MKQESNDCAAHDEQLDAGAADDGGQEMPQQAADSGPAQSVNLVNSLHHP